MLSYIKDLYAKYNIFLNPNEFIKIALNSSYFLLNKINLSARKINGNYFEYYKTHMIPWQKNEKEHILMLLKKIKPMMPWKFAKVTNVESGLMHTICDVIVINDIFWESNISQQIELLIHENIHLYQRKYPKEWEKIVVSYGFEKSNEKNTMLRQNPDTDDIIWYWNEEPLGAIFRNNPKDIFDITGIDHPNEILAYYFASLDIFHT